MTELSTRSDSRVPSISQPLVVFTLKKGDAKSVKALVDRGFDPDQSDREGRTPLMIAAAAGNLAACRLLLAAGADPTRVDPDGRNALRHAADNGKTDVYLLVAEAKVRPSLVSARPPGSPDCDTTSPPMAPKPPPVARPVDRRISGAAGPVPSPDDESLPDGSGWIEAKPAERPADDLASLRSFAASQAALSGTVLKGIGADWSDVEVNLPVVQRFRPTAPPPALPDSEARLRVRKLLLRALADGRIHRDDILTAVERVIDDGMRERILEAIETVLGDLGCVLEDDEVGPLVRPGGRPSGSHDASEVDEAMAAVEEAAPSVTRAWDCHLKDVARHGLLDADEEMLLGRRIRDGRSEALAIVARCPTAVASIIEQSRLAIGDRELTDRLLDLDDRSSRLSGQDGSGGGSADEGGPAERLAGWCSRLADLLPELAAPGYGVPPPDVARMVRSVLDEVPLRLQVIERLTAIVGRDPIESRLLDALGLQLRRVVDGRNRMAASNLRLVAFFARRYARSGMDREDLVQEGYLGLMRAIERFDPDRGNRFATYAGWWIRQSMTRAIADKVRTIRVPVHAWEQLRRMDRFLERELRPNEPTIGEVAAALDLPEHQVRKLMKVPSEPVPLVGDDEASFLSTDPWSAGLPPSQEDVLAGKQMQRVVRCAVNDLHPRLARVVSLRFGLDGSGEKTLEEVGTMFGVTRERIRQIEARALRILRHPGRSRTLSRLI
jgi:RNA polymerase primary sigma factor